MTKLHELRRAVNEHGEIHCVIEEIPGEVEIRKGQVEWSDDGDSFSVYDGSVRHYFDVSRVISYYKPLEVFHVE